MTATVTEAIDETSSPRERRRNVPAGGFGYKPALDGLRAIAVLSVMAYHYDAKWARGGFLGVDMFFVLSGYLITSLLLVEWGRSSTINFGGFWSRRARRLLPALFVLLIVIAVWGHFALSSDAWRSLRADELWTLFYGANWHFIASGQSYFTATPSMLRHAWSLAIEEQFYLVWPLVVFACLRLARGRHQILAAVCVVGSALSLWALLAHFHVGGDPSRAYYGTDSRASQLLVGALLAIVLVHWAPRARWSRVTLQIVGLVGLAAVVVAFAATRDGAPPQDARATFLYHGGFLLFAVATAFVVASVVQPSGSPLGRVLSWRPLRWIGAVSYGLYLWHWPVKIALSEDRTGLSGWELTTLWVVVTFAITALSYYLIEVPIRHRRYTWKWTPRIALPAALGLTLAVILVASAGATTNTLSDQLAQKPGTVISTHHKTPVTQPAVTNPGQVAPPTHRVALMGDSVALSLSDALAAQMAKDGVDFQTTARVGCGMIGVPVLYSGTDQVIPWTPGCASVFPQYVRDVLTQDTPDAVLWLSTWETGDVLVNGQALRFGTPAFDNWLLSDMDAVRQQVVAHGARLVLVTNAPNAPNPKRAISPQDSAKFEHLNDLYYEFAAMHPDSVAVADLESVVCPSGPPCPAVVDGVTLRPNDGGHYEAAGPGWVAPRLVPLVYKALRQIDTAREAGATSSK